MSLSYKGLSLGVSREMATQSWMLFPSTWQRLITVHPEGVALPSSISGSVSGLPGSQEHPWSSMGQGYFQPARLRPLTKEQLFNSGTSPTHCFPLPQTFPSCLGGEALLHQPTLILLLVRLGARSP